MSDAPLQVWLTGTGFWCPTRPNVASLLAGQAGASEPAFAPPASLLTARLRRRASLVTRLCAEVLEQCAPAQPPRIVLTSAWGEIEITVGLLDAIVEGRLLSPTAFHNSVHNAALGYLSIAADNQAPSVAIAAGDDGLAMGALEAVTAVVDDGRPCVFMAAEERVPAPFGDDASPPSVAMGWSLQPTAPNANHGGSGGDEAPVVSRLSLVRTSAAGVDGDPVAGHHAGVPAWLAEGPLGPMAGVIVAHACRRTITLPLGAGWSATLEPLP